MALKYKELWQVERVFRDVKSLLETQKTQLDDTWVSVWVRPKFHWLDHDTKRIAAVAFLEWAKQQRPGVKVVFFL